MLPWATLVCMREMTEKSANSFIKQWYSQILAISKWIESDLIGHEGGTLTFLEKLNWQDLSEDHISGKETLFPRSLIDVMSVCEKARSIDRNRSTSITTFSVLICSNSMETISDWISMETSENDFLNSVSNCVKYCRTTGFKRYGRINLLKSKCQFIQKLRNFRVLDELLFEV
jgi:hypothetical protein